MTPHYPFLKQAGRILNSGQSRTLILTGNIYDLFCLSEEKHQGLCPLDQLSH